MHRTGAILLALAAATPAAAAEGGIEVSRAWMPAVTQTRVDSPLYMTVANRGDAPDTLLRARCPTDLADFTEKHVTDRGEGGLAMREVKTFPIPARETLTLVPNGNHLMLLGVREPLREGRTFTCSVAFQKAGTLQVEVKVAADGAKEAP